MNSATVVLIFIANSLAFQIYIYSVEFYQQAIDFEATRFRGFQILINIFAFFNLFFHMSVAYTVVKN